MAEHRASQSEQFRRVAKRIVDEKTRSSELTAKTVADRLGVSHQMFLRWLREDNYHIHAEKLADLCVILDDFTLLDLLEEKAGRVAFTLPNVKEPLASDEVIAVQRLVKEVGEALQSIANTLEDHIVEDWEIKQTLPKLDDVIRECMRLKYWLKERSVADRGKIKPPQPGSTL